MDGESARRPSELLKRGYSDQEIANIYELGRFFLENGDLRRAEEIFNGIVIIAPDFAPAWLGVAYLRIQNRNFDEAVTATKQALRSEPDSLVAMLYLVACLLVVGDFNSAGTYLGEVAERIEGKEVHPNILRFFKNQLVRYQQRKR
jgi:tetratricopeptide (TPR) repeat protein